MGNGDLTPALGEVDILISQGLWKLFKLSYLYCYGIKLEKKFLLTHKAAKQIIFLSLTIACQNLKQAQ